MTISFDDKKWWRSGYRFDSFIEIKVFLDKKNDNLFMREKNDTPSMRVITMPKELLDANTKVKVHDWTVIFSPHILNDIDSDERKISINTNGE